MRSTSLTGACHLRLPLVAGIVAALAGTPLDVPAQSRISIAVVIDEENDRGVIASAARAALRQLGDVVVEKLSPTTTYIILGHVLCQHERHESDCGHADSYIVSCTLFEPIRES